MTVIAKHMPGDYDIEYASPWAGANFLPLVSSSQSTSGHDVSLRAYGLLHDANVAVVCRLLKTADGKDEHGLK